MSTVRSEKYVNICSDNQAAFKALQAVKTTFPLVKQCRKGLKDISIQHSVGLFWVPGHSGIRVNKIADKLARDAILHHFVGPKPALGVSKENIRKKIKRWIDNQHMVMRRHLISTQRQAQKMILGPSPAVKTRLLSFSRTQSRVVTGLLTGHNTLKRHLHLMGLSCSPVCTRRGAEEETSIHVFCECDALAFHLDAYMGSFFFGPRGC